MTHTPRTGGQVLVDQLRIQGADTVFCVPGESYLEVLDALYDHRDQIALINARHEGGAANMAEAYGKLTGKPGIVMVTRGPGACHAAIGVHVARQDSTPMILFIGQVARNVVDREAFQEVDYRAMFGPLAKWVAQIEDAARIPEYIARAYRVATSGRPGPVVLALPEDMLLDRAQVADALPCQPARANLPESDLAQVLDHLARAERPLLLLGGSGWTDAACAALKDFAESARLPVAVSFRRQDVFDNRSDSYVGELGLAGPKSFRARVAQADLIVTLGARLGDITSGGYEGLVPPRLPQTLIHIHPDADEIGRVFAPDLGLVADAAQVAHALQGRVVQTRAQDWTATLRAEYLRDTAMPTGDWPLDMGQAFCAIRDDLPRDTIITLDAGNHTGWAQRFLRFGRPGRELGSTCGAMGYSVPAAVAASLRHPERLVLSMVGDGGFMMTGQELATATQYGAKPIVLVFNNGSYGTIRMHQERDHPARVSGTDLRGQDFVQIARGYGCHAERVTATAEFAPALGRARAAGRAAVIELVTDPEQITSRTTISALRQNLRATS